MASTTKVVLGKSASRNSSPSSAIVDPKQTDKYLLQVTAGPSYDPSTHKVVNVNSDEAIFVENDLMACWIKVRIRDYHGLPKSSPSTSEYFSHPTHQSDRYSIDYSFVPKKPIPGQDVVMGFDFDRPIRDRLPPGFKTAMKIVTTILDPGIYSDPYSDKPYLYGPALSSFFAFRIGEHVTETPAEQQFAIALKKDRAGVIVEGADGSGEKIREKHSLPIRPEKRRKNFLKKDKIESFEFEEGRLYQADFFNPYLDFANFALRIPGFSISIAKYIDDKTHTLRYVLKNRNTGEVCFLVVFTLLFGEHLEAALKDENVMSSQSSVSESPTESRSLSDSIPPRSNIRDEKEQAEPTSVKGVEANVDPQQAKQPDTSSSAGYLASSLYSALSSLGFGRRVSDSSSSSESNTPEERRAGEQRNNLNQLISNVEDGTVEDYLRSKHESS
ncbi:DUF1769-domain-containing protein [Glonium stellatum]|uniref:DUF1769-domain-containing protein n=1 Tax=Glonium stellatum TaxID=574774 RepID=A0A8E2FAY9_9PEZI|nr:DUF1769-domain-containing protein [Glonium stellatum]